MSTHKPRQMLGTMWRMNIWPYYIFPSIRWPGFVIITSSFSPFSAVSTKTVWQALHKSNIHGRAAIAQLLFIENRSSAIAALPWILDLWSACQTVFVETVFKMNTEFCCHLLWFIDTILFNVWWSLSLSFGFWQLFLLADHVFPWFAYVIITLETAALDTPVGAPT